MINTDALEILNHLNPCSLTYEEWIQVGMALKHEGCSAQDWDDWSVKDTGRYSPGECAKKWNSFRGNGTPITAATMVKLAKDQGWIPSSPQAEPGHELDWDSEIGGSDKYRVIDDHWLQNENVPEPGANWNPAKDLIEYLSTLFRSEERVAYTSEAWMSHKAGKFLPKAGCWDRTAGELIHALQKCDGDIGSVIGDANPEVGAWIRFNPFDGKGIRDENITAHRYALVESDELPVEKQLAIIKELELPVVALVHSGGHSLHAIVHVEAHDYQQYRERVDFLYQVCQRNGMKLDRQNRNPSRLSRMPGIMRNGRKQFLIGVNLGLSSWDEWKEHIEGINDDLPDMTELPLDKSEPGLAPEMIQGVLREGHKLLLSGPSKAGKSFALAQLCIAAASGGEWFGWRVTQGKSFMSISNWTPSRVDIGSGRFATIGARSTARHTRCVELKGARHDAR